jgi:hypothetical protein
MKTKGSSSGIQMAAVLLLVGFATRTVAAEEGQPAKGADEQKKEIAPQDTPTEYRNWVEPSVGGVFIDGDKAAFQRRHSLRRGAFGGIEDLHLETDVGKRGLLTIDGRGIFDNHDYDVRLGLSHPEIGYVRGGYREFRTWYDGSGGFLSAGTNHWISLYEEDFALDRGEAWIEGGLTLPSWPELRLRYSHHFRDGMKDSTSWGDTGLTGLAPPNNIRGIVPSFWIIDEKRDILEADVKHTLLNTDFGLGLRYEISDNENSRNIRRRPGEVTPPPGLDRFLTQREGMDSDLFNAHAFTATRFGERVLFTTGYSFTTIDTDISGSRIYGADYDPVYDPSFERRQTRDHGFLNLGGGSQLKQHVVNFNLMLIPWEHVTLVPSVRIEQMDQEGIASFLETSVGSPPGRITSETFIENTRQRLFVDLSEGLELRYTGLTNWAFYARAEWLQGEGDLEERETEAETGLVFRETDSTRFTQKYVAGANWYPLRRFNVGGQYYYKSRENEYDHSLDSTDNASDDRYPAYFKGQDFGTHDLNFRATWRLLRNLSLISRYDFQISTIDTHPDLLTETQTAESTAHIFSQTISWTPLSRLYLQGSVNYILDQTDTPATGMFPGTNLVLNGENNYWNATALAGIALSEKTDFQAHYSYYRANNYEDNSEFSVPYGAGAEDHGVLAALIHRLTKRMQVTLRYGFFASHDQTSGGHNDYRAHLVYSSLRCVF